MIRRRVELGRFPAEDCIDAVVNADLSLGCRCSVGVGRGQGARVEYLRTERWLVFGQDSYSSVVS